MDIKTQCRELNDYFHTVEKDKATPSVDAKHRLITRYINDKSQFKRILENLQLYIKAHRYPMGMWYPSSNMDDTTPSEKATKVAHKPPSKKATKVADNPPLKKARLT